jgi:hypothetical protein
MSHPWLKPVIMYLLPLAILGLALGVFFRSLGTGHAELVAVEPEVAEVAVDPLQFQAVTVHLQLTNHTSKTIQVRKAETSCGCASLVTRGGKTLVEPLDVPSGGAVPWQVVIHTGARSGPNEFMVFFETESGGRISQMVSTIKMNIRPAIAYNPRVIEFGDVGPGSEHTATIVLSDGYPDSGYNVAHVHVSDPERLEVKIMPPDKDTPTGLAEADSSANLRVRWYIKLRYLSPKAARALVQDEIILEPENDLHPQISIPVTCKMTPPAYEISPETLVFSADSLGRTIQRTIRCRMRPEADAALKVNSAPSWAKVDVVHLDAQTEELRVTLKVPQLAADASAIKPIVIGSGSSASNAFSIPIEFVGPN